MRLLMRQKRPARHHHSFVAAAVIVLLEAVLQATRVGLVCSVSGADHPVCWYQAACIPPGAAS